MTEVEGADALFSVVPESFVAARDELTKQLRAAGKRDLAAQVKRLRRPTLPAWAVNAAVRREASGLDELVAAHAALSRVQRRALSGVRNAGLREAAERRRAAVDRLTAAAVAALHEAGHGSATHRGAIAATFEAAAVDEEALAAVASGRLSKELAPPSGFGGLAGLALVAEPDDVEEKALSSASERDHEAPAAHDERAEAERAATGSAKRDAVLARLADARRQKQKADRALDRARQRAEQAADERTRAQAEADALEQDAARARQRADRLAADAAGRERAAGEAADTAARRGHDLEEAEAAAARLEEST